MAAYALFAVDCVRVVARRCIIRLEFFCAYAAHVEHNEASVVCGLRKWIWEITGNIPPPLVILELLESISLAFAVVNIF